MNKRTLIFPALLFFLLSTLGIYHGQGQNPATVIILHTNDMHARIDNMAKLAYLADSLHKLNPNVFLVAAGDNFTGNPNVDMVPDKGFPMIDLMNHCGFKVSAVGNHEFDMGQEFLHKRFQQARFPFVCSNLDASGALLGTVKPYVVLGADNGDSIVLLGLIQLDDNGLPSSIPTHMTGIRFTAGLTAAREYAWLKKHYGNLIALSHLGVEDDVKLADSMAQFDLIIGGHSHTLLEKPRIENGVMIVQAGSYLKYVGKTTFRIDHGKISNLHDELISFESLKPENGEVHSLIDRYSNNKEFDQVVGTAEKPVEGLDQLGSLMTDAITSQLKVDFAFQNKGGIRIPSLSEGNITLRDIFKLDPFNNQVVLFSMTVDEIKSLICYGYQHEKEIDLQVSGMNYRITDNGKKQCAQVEVFDKSGKALDPTHEYSVAMNNYIASAYKFDHKDPGTITKVNTNDALISYLREVKKVNYMGTKRATVVN
ncbi:MAG: bifunctional UDP-sugar hydrolase/5'-nucleotidase [Bacteroidota bacterium]